MVRLSMHCCGGNHWFGALRGWGAMATAIARAAGDGVQTGRWGRQGLSGQMCVNGW